MGSYIEQRKEKMPKARALYAKGLTAGRIAKILSMSRTTVCRWIANFAEEKEKNMATKQRNKKKSEVSVSTEIHNPSLPDQGKAKAHSSASAKDESAEQKISRLEKAAQEAFVLEYIHRIRKLDHGIGGMKLWYMYKRDFPDIERVGRDRFEDIVHRHTLRI